MYISKASLRQDAVTNRNFWKLVEAFGDNYKIHNLVWSMFSEDPDKKGIFFSGRKKVMASLCFTSYQKKSLRIKMVYGILNQKSTIRTFTANGNLFFHSAPTLL